MDRILIYSLANIGENVIGEEKSFTYKGIVAYAAGEGLYQIFQPDHVIPQQKAIFHGLFQFWANTLIMKKGVKYMIVDSLIAAGVSLDISALPI